MKSVNINRTQSKIHRMMVKSIEFRTQKFRKLSELKIIFSEGINLISGHNGIGKSTILGLIAASSGLTKNDPENNTYAGKQFQTELSDVIYIGANEIPNYSPQSNPIITYFINGHEELKKRCSLTIRRKAQRASLEQSEAFKRARIVPRNWNPSSDFESTDGTIQVGSDSKTPLPTIYLGMTRVLPIAEADESDVISRSIEEMESEDRNLVTDFVKSVMLGLQANNTKITSNRIARTSKFSSHPDYDYDSHGVSLGQDSLGSIAAALASFNRLKRKMSDKYHGGLLLIDEIDCGFHPHAISRLVNKLDEISGELGIQIIATTHSIAMISAVLEKNRQKKAKNSVSYLYDSAAPRLMNYDQPSNIFDDLELKPPSRARAKKNPDLVIYLEDDESCLFFDRVVNPSKKRAINKEFSVNMKAIGLGVGCDSLANFTKKNPEFRKNIFCLDGDYSPRANRKNPENVIKLPGNKSPERLIIEFLFCIVKNEEKYREVLSSLDKRKLHRDQIIAHLLNDVNENMEKREDLKTWWKAKQRYIKQWSILDLWIEQNPEAVKKFESELREAIRAVKKHIRGAGQSREAGVNS